MKSQELRPPPLQSSLWSVGKKKLATTIFFLIHFNFGGNFGKVLFLKHVGTIFIWFGGTVKPFMYFLKKLLMTMSMEQEPWQI